MSRLSTHFSDKGISLFNSVMASSRETASRASGLGHKSHARIQPENSRARDQAREREKGEARLLALHRLELHIRAPGHEFTEGLSGLQSVREKQMTPSQKRRF